MFNAIARTALSAVLGMTLGLVFAVLYSLYALVLFLLRGRAPFDANGVTIVQVVGLYLAGGIVAGAVAGLLRPLGRTWPGAMFVGAIAAFPVGVAVNYTLQGPLALQDWFVPVAFALLLGAPAGLTIRRQFGDWFAIALDDEPGKSRKPGAAA